MDKISINGKTYALCVNTTISQDRELERVLRAANLKEISLREGETEEQAVSRIYGEVVDSGIWADLLACRIAPVGEKWTPAVIPLIAAELDMVSDDEEKAAIRRIIPWIVAGFFVTGLTSLAASLVYSHAQEEMRKEAALKFWLTGRGSGWLGRSLATILRACHWCWTLISSRRAPATSKS
jgi:hypothetical protein